MAAELNVKARPRQFQLRAAAFAICIFKANPTLPTNATADMSTLTDFESLGELSSDSGFSESRSISANTKGAHGTVIMTTIDNDNSPNTRQLSWRFPAAGCSRFLVILLLLTNKT